jgi:hypothetical protein
MCGAFYIQQTLDLLFHSCPSKMLNILCPLQGLKADLTGIEGEGGRDGNGEGRRRILKYFYRIYLKTDSCVLRATSIHKTAGEMYRSLFLEQILFEQLSVHLASSIPLTPLSLSVLIPFLYPFLSK